MKFSSILESTQPPSQWVPPVVSLWIKRQGREADHSPSSNSEDKNGGAIPPLSHTTSRRPAQLIKARDNITFYLLRFKMTM
jgi:hypothetical protein